MQTIFVHVEIGGQKIDGGHIYCKSFCDDSHSIYFLYSLLQVENIEKTWNRNSEKILTTANYLIF